MTKKEEPNSEYVSVPIYIEYGTTDPTEPKGSSKIFRHSRKIKFN